MQITNLNEYTYVKIWTHKSLRETSNQNINYRSFCTLKEISECLCPAFLFLLYIFAF